MMRAMTHLESASCAIGSYAKELLTKMRANTPWPVPRPASPRAPGVQPCHHQWGNHAPARATLGAREKARGGAIAAGAAMHGARAGAQESQQWWRGSTQGL
jgi:hypothetical protein